MTLEISALMKLKILWGIQRQPLFRKYLLYAWYVLSTLPAINKILMEFIMLTFKIQLNKNCDGKYRKPLKHGGLL